MSKQELIKPRIMSGFMELSPDKQLLFDKMIDEIKHVYQSFCFMPLDTPVLELSEILLAKSGGEIDKEVYHFTKGDTNICMRYDLTVPLARYVAMNSNTLSFPFKRYQIGKVYRGERAQRGRFREFVQCDGDIVGLETLPISADAECIFLIDKIFNSLNLDILIQISNRNILVGYLQELGIIENAKQVLTILDKINKIGRENAMLELKALNITDNTIEKLLNIISLKGDFDKILPMLENLASNEIYQKGFDELRKVYHFLSAYGIDKSRYCLDISIIRGQDYYTGTVFEAVIPTHLQFGTVCGGGRYDNLAGYFSEKKMPGVGLSIGLTRLFDLLDKNDMLPSFSKTNTTLQIIPLGDHLDSCFTLQAYFSNKINCEVAYEERSFKAKLKDAGKKQIPFVLIVGDDEVEQQLFMLKNMETGEQTKLSKEECLELILKTIN